MSRSAASAVVADERDPGDEDQRNNNRDWCPFCGAVIEWRKAWRFAIRSGSEDLDWPYFDAAPLTNESNRDEIVTCCNDEQCKRSASRFFDEHRRYREEKQARAYLHWQRTKAGA